jgi:hypothetical protein
VGRFLATLAHIYNGALWIRLMLRGEQGAPQNGGPATALDSSGVAERPPSVN